jgi:hypothetical protein
MDKSCVHGKKSASPTSPTDGETRANRDPQAPKSPRAEPGSEARYKRLMTLRYSTWDTVHTNPRDQNKGHEAAGPHLAKSNRYSVTLSACKYTALSAQPQGDHGDQLKSELQRDNLDTKHGGRSVYPDIDACPKHAQGFLQWSSLPFRHIR